MASLKRLLLIVLFQFSTLVISSAGPCINVLGGKPSDPDLIVLEQDSTVQPRNYSSFRFPLAPFTKDSISKKDRDWEEILNSSTFTPIKFMGIKEKRDPAGRIKKSIQFSFNDQTTKNIKEPNFIENNGSEDSLLDQRENDDIKNSQPTTVVTFQTKNKIKARSKIDQFLGGVSHKTFSVEYKIAIGDTISPFTEVIDGFSFYQLYLMTFNRSESIRAKKIVTLNEKDYYILSFTFSGISI